MTPAQALHRPRELLSRAPVFALLAARPRLDQGGMTAAVPANQEGGPSGFSAAIEDFRWPRLAWPAAFRCACEGLFRQALW